MAEKPKRKPAQKRKMTKAEQSERFKETARRLDLDESGEAFERTLKTALAYRQTARRKLR